MELPTGAPIVGRRQIVVPPFPSILGNPRQRISDGSRSSSLASERWRMARMGATLDRLCLVSLCFGSDVDLGSSAYVPTSSVQTGLVG